jgi:hypothetical protein
MASAFGPFLSLLSNVWRLSCRSAEKVNLIILYEPVYSIRLLDAYAPRRFNTTGNGSISHTGNRMVLDFTFWVKYISKGND